MKDKKDNKKDRILSILTIFFLLVFAFEFIFGIHYMKINGDSMTPGIKNGSFIMTSKMINDNQRHYKRGDIITFNAYGVDPRCTQKNQKYIKRIIGVPGDKISFNGKQVFINGKPENQVIDKKFKTDESKSGTVSLTGGKTINKWDLATLSNRKMPNGNFYWNQESIGLTTVPNGCYFVMGDHRSVSNDSREFGFVPSNHIIGKLLLGN